MATAKKLPSGSWRVLVYDYTDDNGKRIYKSFTSDDTSMMGKRKAEYLAAEYARSKERVQKNEIIFIDALEKYIKEKEPVLSPSTIRGYINIKNVLKKKYPDFCKIRISDISQEDIQKVVNCASANKSPKTVRNYHSLITAVMYHNKVNMTVYTTLPQKKKPVLYIPTDDDIKTILKYAKGKELEVPIMLAAFGCMRRGEICGLSMDDIDGNIIHVHHSLVADHDCNLHLKAPKTDSGDRYVEVPSFVIEKIKERGYITKVKPHTITTEFEKLLDKHGIPRFRFHDLRHYSASIRHALNIPDAFIMEDGGWGSDRILKEVYRHAMGDRKRQMNDIIISHFEDMQHEMQHGKEKSR